MTREDALERLKVPAIPESEAKHDFEYIAAKLDIPVEELLTYFNQPNKTYLDYKNQLSMFQIGAKILKYVGIEKSIKR